MMKRIFLAGLAVLASWAGSVPAQSNPQTNPQSAPSGGQVLLPPTLGRTATAADAPTRELCCKPDVLMPRPGHGWSDGAGRWRHANFGRLAHEIFAPIRLATGNLLPTCGAPAISRADVERMIADGHYSPAEITAAKIKLDESQAQARRAAVRYLAKVSCHYYPEAECGLIAALRADRNECVRLEAALAMGTCDCLTPKIAEALQVAVSGGETDGNPAEISERVRSAALQALSRYHARGIGLWSQMLPPSDWTPPSPGPMPTPMPITIQPLSAFTPATPQEIQRAENVGMQPTSARIATGQRTLYHLIIDAMGTRETAPASSNVAPPARRVPTPRSLGLTPLGSEANLAIPRE